MLNQSCAAMCSVFIHSQILDIYIYIYISHVNFFIFTVLGIISYNYYIKNAVRIKQNNANI